MKECHSCKTLKLESEFHKHKYTKDGLQPYCKECRVKTNRKWQRENPDKMRVYRQKSAHKIRAWNSKNKDKIREYRRKWRIKNPTKYQCMVDYNGALMYGLILKSPVCWKCGTRENIQGHHHDYSKPYAVSWFCRKCHVELHVQKRRNVV